MLILTHRTGDRVHIQPKDGVPPEMTVRELFADGPIRIFVGPVLGKQVKLAVGVPVVLGILQTETDERLPAAKPWQR